MPDGLSSQSAYCRLLVYGEQIGEKSKFGFLLSNNLMSFGRFCVMSVYIKHRFKSIFYDLFIDIV